MNAHKFVAEFGIEREQTSNPVDEILFVAEFGIERAKAVVEGAGLRHKSFTPPSMYHLYEITGTVNLEELKQVVESVEIVKELDGIKGAKATLYNLVQLDWAEFEHRYIDNWTCTKDRLQKAIADYELIEFFKENQHV
ncbi:hypothetical protein [Acinetobacter guerrae]|uniref:hypothetical protein n=1 Tax=Acinetobacter guerrae TaxID=1843371 RepID=UPI00125FD280|nr:hypothetical protein [Acinetobacter guerrae]